MVDYFLNQMGIYSKQWYARNDPDNLYYTSIKIDDAHRATVYNCNVGDTVEVQRVRNPVAAGRIDIRDESKSGYDGWDEYSVAPMTQRSWSDFGNWLMDLETETVLTQLELEERYEYETGRKIEYVFETDWCMWDKPTTDYESPL